MPRLIAFVAALAVALPAAAHPPPGAVGADLAWRWNLEPWLAGLLAASGALYALGVARLWRKAGRGRGLAQGQAARFAAGWLTLCVALVSPVDTLGGALFSMHMVQHELLMVLAAPLLVLGRPLQAWTWAMPGPWRPRLAQAAHAWPLAAAWQAVTAPLAAWTLHALALWAWHAPLLFEAALADDRVHALQHASFLGSALLFWWAVLGRGTRRPDGSSVASVFTTLLHTGALGALLTFAPTPWYAHYRGAAALGLSALEDQQLGGLVMWVPGSLAYLVAGLAIVGLWVARPAQQALR
jgi:putative membrane protein